MCGICGVIDYNRGPCVSEELIGRMCAKLKHRGPDDEGIFVSRNSPFAGLGHRRLSIIDLSASGHQPMSNEDGSVWIVFNGEIYNFQDLRKELEAKGHVFKSHTDSEAILHLYEEYKERCVDRLRGMFAFAVWDDRNKALFIARDRLGKKPLLYAYTGGVFSFASEFSSLLESPAAAKEIRRQSVDNYLSFGYIPAPFTIYKDVFKLPPAHFLTLKGSVLKIERYWDPDYSRKIKISQPDAQAQLTRLLEEAVKIRMYSEVPLGAFLSGGIDSSTVVALMSRFSQKKVKTFSVGFKEQDYSELKYARLLARQYDTEHHEFIVEPKALEVLPLLVERYGEPYADSSCIPTYYVARQTREFVTVALNGDGGDELFAGYDRYPAMYFAQSLPKALRSLLFYSSRFLPDAFSPKSSLRRAKRFFNSLGLSEQSRYLKLVSVFDEGLKKEMYGDDFAASCVSSDSFNFIGKFLSAHKESDIISRLLYTDAMTYLPYDLLVKVDIATMANSLEGRSPFLDHKLVEFCASLPSGLKLRWLNKKFILKKMIRGMVPDENVYRRKMGFGVPVGDWFCAELKDFLSDTLLSKKALSRGYFKPQAIKSLVRLHTDNKQNFTLQLWALLMLELWHKNFID